MRAFGLGVLAVVAMGLLLGCGAASRSVPDVSAGPGDNIPVPVSAEVAAVEARPQAVKLRRMLADGVTGNEAIRAHLREELATIDKDDPLAGWMTLRLAYMDMRVGDWPSARANFRRVATSEVAAPLEVRAEATTRFARISNAPAERAEAIRTWGEIDREAGDNWWLRASARHHMAALMVDQAAASPGTETFENVRIFVADSLSILPANNRRIASMRAAVAASGVDSWAKESKWAEFLTAHDKWMAEHGEAGTGDDWGNLMYSRGVGLTALNREAEAEKAMLAALGLDGGSPDKRRGLWTRQQSLRWLSNHATRQGAADEAGVWTALNTLISSEAAIRRLHERAEKQDRPVEAELWSEVRKGMSRIQNWE